MDAELICTTMAAVAAVPRSPGTQWDKEAHGRPDPDRAGAAADEGDAPAAAGGGPEGREGRRAGRHLRGDPVADGERQVEVQHRGAGRRARPVRRSLTETRYAGAARPGLAAPRLVGALQGRLHRLVYRAGDRGRPDQGQPAAGA